MEPEKLKPGDLVGVNKDSYLILDTLPSEYDSRVKAMEVDTRPTEQYSDIGGLDKQIQELVEAVVLPMTHKDRFVNLGIKPPKVRPMKVVSRLSSAGSADVRPPRHRQDPDGPSLRRADTVLLPQAGRAPASTDVHW